MSKLLNVYSDNIDRTWYKSSNILYSECIDNDNKPKTLKVVFSNGRQYQYNDVDVRDYLFFRDGDSQGKALNSYIKKYTCTRLEDVNVDVINEEYTYRSHNGMYIDNNDKFTIKDHAGIVLYELDKALDADTYDMINDILLSVGVKIKKL